MTSKFSTLALMIAMIALGVTLFQSSITPPKPAHETTYERVMRTKTLRCAYFMWRPILYKDPTTGVVSGIMPDILGKMGQALGLKIDYVEEVNFIQMFEGFKTNRYDAVCGPVTPSAQRAAHADFVTPFAYSSLNAYARADDTRFDGGVSTINQPSVRIATIEGEMSATIAPLKFPQAKTLFLPNIGDGASLLMQVTTNKADVVITDPFSAGVFMTANPGQLREVPGGHVIFLPATMAVPLNEYALKTMLDHSINDFLQTGYVASLIKQYGLADGMFIPAPSVSKP